MNADLTQIKNFLTQLNSSCICEEQGAPNPTHGWWAPVALCYKERWGPAAHSMRLAVHRQTHRKTLARSEGAQKQREAAASAPRLSSSSTPLAPSPPQPTPSRRLCSRPRHRHPGVDLSASIVAAFERIFISEPVMAAGSSSSAGGDGLSLYFPTGFLLLPIMQ